MSEIEEYWEGFLKSSGQNKDEVGFSGELVFENEGNTGEEQLALVLSGEKTASFTPFPAYAINFEPLPVAGEIYIVEDRNGSPKCIIEITNVSVIPFNEVTWEMARQEGEDENLQQWQDKQREFLAEEAEICGFDFTEETQLVFEIFRVIYR